GHLWIGFTLAAAISSCAADAGSSIAVAHVRSADLAATLSTPAAQAAAQTAWLKVRSMRPDQFAEATLSSFSDQP
ncbi:hypothetical protein ACMWQU_27920, partial [Escherichia coli]|uniref:hypothetical protein n=1 Tax=Escherichia coli TaxID=562 RepID=UPI0039E1B94E